MNLVKKLTIVFVMLISIYIGSLTAVFCLPNENITKNVLNSMDDVVAVEAAGYRVKRDTKILGDGPISYVDALTDGVMLTRNLNYNEVKDDKAQAFQGFFQFPYEFPFEYYNNPLKSALNMNGYGRYWHGYEIALRPLLMVFNYQEIRCFNFFLLSILIICCTLVFYRTCGVWTSALFCLALALCKLPLIPLSIQFMNMYILTMLAIIALGLWILPQNAKYIIDRNNDNIYVYAFVLGSLTVFFDLLTTPLLPIGLSVLYLVVYMYKRFSYVVSWKFLRNVFFLWGIACVLTWLVKWLFNSFVLNENMLLQAYQQILLRISNPIELNDGTVMEASYIIALTVNLLMLRLPFSSTLFLFMIGSLLVLVVIGRIAIPNCNTNREYLRRLLLLALLPCVWYVVIKNHSQIHYWYTYRSLIVTILSLGFYVEHLVEWSKINLLLKGKNK